MATIHCPGGHTFSDGEVPSPHEFVLIADRDVETVAEEVEKIAREGEDVGARAIYAISKGGATAYKCPFCGRLIVFWNGIEQPAASYLRES